MCACVCGLGLGLKCGWGMYHTGRCVGNVLVLNFGVIFDVWWIVLYRIVLCRRWGRGC